MNDLTLYLLTIRGTLSPGTLEEARKIHNMTAGDPQGVAAILGATYERARARPRPGLKAVPRSSGTPRS